MLSLILPMSAVLSQMATSRKNKDAQNKKYTHRHLHTENPVQDGVLITEYD